MDNISTFTKLLEEKNRFSFKKINEFLDKKNQEELNDISSKIEFLLRKSDSGRLSMIDLVESYIEMNKSLLVEKMFFLKNRRYRYNKFDDALKNVYQNDELMNNYLIWIFISNLIHENHTSLFNFFVRNVRGCQGNKYLEVGVGHGLFFQKVLDLNLFNEYTGIDVSESSISMTSEFLDYMGTKSDFKLIHKDIFDFNSQEKFDFISCGEVIEHVENPSAFLKKFNDLLSENGKIYISTATNSPFPDHIYLFQKTDDIEAIIYEAGFVVVDRIVISAEGYPKSKWKDGMEMSVGYILEKKNERVN